MAYWRINQNIRAPKLRVIDPEGKQLGIFSAQEALKLVEAKGLDLVEIAPKADPPVAKIIDFAKFRYQEEKREREKRAKQKRGAELKEVWLTPFMAENDYQVRMEKIKEFLGQGHKVRIAVRFKGRQMGHKEFGYEMAERVKGNLEGLASIDGQPRFIGRQLLVNLTPVKKG